MTPTPRPVTPTPTTRRVAHERRARIVRYVLVAMLGTAATLLAGWSAVLEGVASPAPTPTPDAPPERLAAITPIIPTPVKPTLTPTATPTATEVASEEAAPPPELPDSVRLEVPNHKQERQLSCELRSASDLALYYGREITWEQLFREVGHDLNGDPNMGFVGKSIDDPSGGLYPDGYGVHAAPIARGLRALGINATAHDAQTVDWLKARLAAGDPVVVWATAGLTPSRRVEWQTQDGRTVWGVRWEHTFTAVGYDAGGLWLNDPFTGATDYYDWHTFETAWTLLGNMAVTIDATPL